MFKYLKVSLLSLLGTLSLGSWSLIGSILLLTLAFFLNSGLLLLDDILVLLDGFGVKLDGGVAGTAIIAIPVLGHEDSSAASRAVLLQIGDETVV